MGSAKKWSTNSPAETQHIAASLARKMQPGDIVALYGELASGKTTFVQGICEALSVREPVTSPTYTLINEYFGTMPVYHFDCYRLENEDEFYSLGYEEYFFGEGLVLIEWAERVESLLPEHTIRLRFEHNFSGEGTRTIQLHAIEEQEELCTSLP
ncbi:MAG: tRNA threonylcarbamoyladenosine biosynthesis protein TsaE [Candidatus Marinimicrobia bacterium]|nr:tRNA threonylcarbamoyladenosine biosynthesis protein TsaE [Candidatus Neomarinimicrobiota bacterium]